MVRVKICGITRKQDLMDAVFCGANAVGFVFARSPRQISRERAKVLVRAVPVGVTTVGVFVNVPARNVLRVAEFCGLEAVQLHGDEPDTQIRSLQKAGLKVIKAFRVGRVIPARALQRTSADAVLLDTKSKDLYGGTGKSFDWNCLAGLRCKKPVIVSGGLKPDNVQRLLKQFTPYAVDVSSGVEIKPGIKSKKLMQKFMNHVTKK